MHVPEALINWPREWYACSQDWESGNHTRPFPEPPYNHKQPKRCHVCHKPMTVMVGYVVREEDLYD